MSHTDAQSEVALPTGRAAPVSLHAALLVKLRDHLVEGPADGARISERALCSLFGVSRTPLREALKVLAAEGLVELLPNRGARVRSLEHADLRELFDVVGGLEALAGRLACEQATDQDIARVERLHHEMYAFYLRRDLHGYFSRNQDIHGAIFAIAGNRALASAYAGLAGRLRRVRYAANFARRRDRWGEAMREHEAILDALQRRAGEELSDVLFRHLRNKRTAALEQLAEASPASSGPDGD